MIPTKKRDIELLEVLSLIEASIQFNVSIPTIQRWRRRLKLTGKSGRPKKEK